MTAMASLNMGGYARALRREIIQRNRDWSKNTRSRRLRATAKEQVVVYPRRRMAWRTVTSFPQSYAAILRVAGLAQAITKPTPADATSRNTKTDKWRELDSCTSSDALPDEHLLSSGNLGDGKFA